MQVRDFLDRFRPAGAPGSAARAAVPADRTRELAAELDPVLALLDDVQAECDQIAAAAQAEAERITGAARAQATVIAQEAGARARSARDEAMREVMEQAEAEADELAAAGRREAAAIRRRARARMPKLVSEVTDQVLAWNGTGPLP